MKTIHVDFHHGLGDCAYFAHQLAVYRENGFEIKVHCALDKEFMFRPFQDSIPGASGSRVSWNHGKSFESLDDSNHWCANKAFVNFGTPPMPMIEVEQSDLWSQFANTRIDLEAYIGRQAVETVSSYFAPLPRPIVLLHTRGNSFQEAKSVPDTLALDIYREIIDQTDGTLILLDWDNRVPRVAHGRVRHLTDDWKHLSAEELFAAITQADLLVGIDSGPLHLCRFTKTPAVGLWFNRHHPAKYSLPRDEQVNVTLKRNSANENKYTRWFYNVVEEQGEQIRASTVGRVCRQMLQPPRYLGALKRGKDVMLQHWINDWEKAGLSTAGTFIDRDKSFDIVLQYATQNELKRFVETGCIRAEEDWRGAGFGTYLLGAYAAAQGGRLDSVDTNSGNCSFAQKWTRVFGDAVEMHCQDSVQYLLTRDQPIDVLYLDSWDTYVRGYAEHGLREIEAAERLLHKQSIIIYDDTSYQIGNWQGKGKLGVPWLLKRGWQTLHVGHQTVMAR